MIKKPLEEYYVLINLIEEWWDDNVTERNKTEPLFLILPSLIMESKLDFSFSLANLVQLECLLLGKTPPVPIFELDFFKVVKQATYNHFDLLKTAMFASSSECWLSFIQRAVVFTNSGMLGLEYFDSGVLEGLPLHGFLGSTLNQATNVLLFEEPIGIAIRRLVAEGDNFKEMVCFYTFGAACHIEKDRLALLFHERDCLGEKEGLIKVSKKQQLSLLHQNSFLVQDSFLRIPFQLLDFHDNSACTIDSAELETIEGKFWSTLHTRVSNKFRSFQEHCVIYCSGLEWRRQFNSSMTNE